MSSVRRRVLATVAGAIAAIALATASVHAYGPPGNVTVTVGVACSSAGATAHCTTTARATNAQSGDPAGGIEVDFAATYRGLDGQAVSGPGGRCGGMSPCSAPTDSGGKVTSALVTGVCDATVTVTASVAPTSSHNGASAQSQAQLRGCAGGTTVSLPFTSAAPPQRGHLLGGALVAGGGLAALAAGLWLLLSGQPAGSSQPGSRSRSQDRMKASRRHVS